ncbi:hypothetical protein GWI33_009551 [Rhynchophorus ferrugineus]|uniref:TNFR-Cys domain-containing protein n=1 Tax=Rhynchophorus ferrugineus TaxID=354439 RepID=A0A834IST2_RHYFE|nr:hypothetical protein GWI33_009551 [Rhynchophorus ferrugineus]
MRGLLLVVLVALLHNFTQASPGCEDWTLCTRVRCAAPPEKCPEGEYLVWDSCGCCQSCSKQPKTGPCGTCGTDVVCKEQYPICSEGQITTIDYCGCCKVCKDTLDEGARCGGKDFAVCKYGLKCIRKKCRREE